MTTPRAMTPAAQPPAPAQPPANAARSPSPPRPLLIWDGDCCFCARWIARWRLITGDRVAYEPYQSAAARFPHIPLERFERGVQLIEPDGRCTEGAEAVYGALAAVPGLGMWLWAYRRIRPFSALSEAAYRFVARHRPQIDRLTYWLPVPRDARD
jgi:predicted DCC family thiol-disulfide oxidoreductase YuxK